MQQIGKYLCGGGCGLVAKSCLTLATSWTVAFQAPLSLKFCRLEYWSGLPFPSPGDLPDPGIEPVSPALKEDSLPTELPGKQKAPLGALESTLGRRFTMLNDEYSTDTN